MDRNFASNFKPVKNSSGVAVPSLSEALDWAKAESDSMHSTSDTASDTTSDTTSDTASDTASNTTSDTTQPKPYSSPNTAYDLSTIPNFKPVTNHFTGVAAPSLRDTLDWAKDKSDSMHSTSTQYSGRAPPFEPPPYEPSASSDYSAPTGNTSTANIGNPSNDFDKETSNNSEIDIYKPIIY